MKRLMSICLIVMLLCVGLPTAALAQEDGALRVMLKSLGLIDSLSVQFSGSYSLNEDPAVRFDRGAVVTFTASGNNLYLKTGGLTMIFPDGVNLTRHEAEGENGLYLNPSPRGNLYCGDLRLTAQDGSIECILTLDIEDYLMGVVPYEMNDAFPLEALKAQAVAARTYALKRRSVSSGRSYDVVDTTADQVFFGYDAQYVNAREAVLSTRGVVGIYQGDYATCYYTASNGGQTALATDIFGYEDTGKFGYLAVCDDPYDLENPSSVARTLSLHADTTGLPDLLSRWLKDAAAEPLSAMGYADDPEDIFLDRIVSVTPHSPRFEEETKMSAYLTIGYTVSACPVRAVYEEPSSEELIRSVMSRQTVTRQLLGYEEGEPELLDTVFEFDLDVYDQLKDQLGLSINGADYETVSVDEARGENGTLEGFTVTLRRFGHGVGMSQRGAQWMAGQYGKSCRDILNFYYPGLTFEKREYSTPGRPALESLNAQAQLPELREGERYAVVTLATAWSTLNLRQSPSTDSAVITALGNGKRVILISLENGWAHVRTALLEGYVSADYLTIE